MTSIEFDEEELGLTVEALMEQANGVAQTIERLESEMSVDADEAVPQVQLRRQLDSSKALLSRTMDIAIKLKDANIAHPAGS